MRGSAPHTAVIKITSYEIRCTLYVNIFYYRLVSDVHKSVSYDLGYPIRSHASRWGRSRNALGKCVAGLNVNYSAALSPTKCFRGYLKFIFRQPPVVNKALGWYVRCVRARMAYVCGECGDLCIYDRKVCSSLTLANVRSAYHSSPRRETFRRTSVWDYLRSCANLSSFVTLVDAVESNNTYMREVMILINPLVLLISSIAINQCE